MNQTIIVLALLSFVLVSGAPAAAWTTEISLSSGDRTDVLTLGSEDGVSDEFDAGIDIPLPPPLPSTSFSAYLVGNGLFEMLQTDIRTTHSWNICVTSMEPIDIAWTAAPFPLTMALGEDWFSLTESGHHLIGSGEYWITIRAAQSPPSPESTALEDVSPFPVSTISGTPLSASSTTTPSAPPTTPDQNSEYVALPSATAVQDTMSGTPQLPQDGETANQTPGFGAVLTILGISMLTLARKTKNEIGALL